MITVEINSVDVSNQIAFETLKVIQNLTNEVDVANFSLRKYGARTLAPAFNDDVVIKDGTTTIFAGKIMEVSLANETSLGVFIDVQCVDHTAEFDRVLASRAYKNTSIKDIIDDLVATYAPTFTTTNVTSTYVIEKVVFNQITLSQCLRKLAEIMRFDWYIDENKDVHFFDKLTNTAPFGLTDTNGKYVFNSLQKTDDGSQVVNRVKVRGGEYDGDTFTDVITVSGDDSKSFKLPYKFANLTIELDTGGGYVSKTVGVDFIDDFTAKDVLYNYADQSFRFESPLADGDKIRFAGNPKVPVLAIAEDPTSVANYGIIEKLIRDNSITSNVVARKRASAELLAFAETVIDVKFKTYEAGLRAGQLISVQSTIRDINESLLIKRLVFKTRTPVEFEYDVQCISTQRYTLLDLLRRFMETDDRINENEVSEQIFAINEEIDVAEEITVVAPKDVDEVVTTTDATYKDAVAPDDLVWVYGYYAPSAVTDTKRMARYDRDSVYM